MSKRRNVKKPSYVISDSEDDEDFVLPAAKRAKSSQDKVHVDLLLLFAKSRNNFENI